MAKAYLSLGSNQDPEQHIYRAIEELREYFGTIILSPIYRTAAIGFDGADFLNAAAMIETHLDPIALNNYLHDLEDKHGRRRDQRRFSDRPLDIDIVFYDDLILKGPGHLQIPRPELAHAFVLKPLTDIAPNLKDPLSGKTLAELWAVHPEASRPPIAETSQSANARPPSTRII